jgi:site-specific DNA-methyltransferase (cytosine-N4-specific)
LINTILLFLEEQKEKKKLNNNGIPRMVRGYFQEMAVVISESFRILDHGGYVFMVNDNVRYAGICIPVDLILSKMAEDMGFEILNILVLPQEKGNSSQQMGGFGRESLRKCVYVWRKP